MQVWLRGGGWCDALWLLSCALASSLWCLGASSRLSATFDETIYLERGLERWHTGSYAALMRLGTMPLPVDVETLPLYLAERYRGRPFDLSADMDRLLPWARAAALPFWWLLLLYGWLAGRHLAGPWGGRLAVALLACEPTLLAHAALATTDMAITACLLALVYHFASGRDAGWFRRGAVPAFWFGAAVLAKASGLVFGPLCLGIIEGQRRIGNREQGTGIREQGTGNRGIGMRVRSLFPVPCSLFPVLGGGLLLVFLYVGSDWRAEPSFVQWADRLPEGTAAETMRWLAGHLCIFTNAGEGLVQQIKHNIRSHGGAFLLGAESPRAFWYYFPVALAIKLSLPLLLLPLLVLVVRPSALGNWACLCAGVLLLFSINCRVQIGVRLVLPLVGLVVVGLAAAAVQAVHTCRPGLRRGLGAGLLGSGVAWTVVAAIAVWPHGLCYVNEAWGGPNGGYLLLSDSNYDWGQGLKELAHWQHEHAEAPLDVWYFGSDPTVRQLPMRTLPLHLLPIHGPEDVRTQVRGHYLAVGTTLLHGRTSEFPGHRTAATFLRSCQPVARTATFLIFDFRSCAGADARR